jgi:hypothetical protein
MRAIRRILVLGLAIGACLSPAAVAPSSAAPPQALRITADVTYEVRPRDELVRVLVNATATDLKPDPPNGRFYYTSGVMVLLGGAAHFRATAAGKAASVTVREATKLHTVVEVAFNRSIFYGESTNFSLAFDLPTGAANSQVRVGRSVAAFPVWAMGTPDTPGGSVTISLPPDYALQVDGEALPPREERRDGGSLYRWTSIPDPVAFALFATADLATLGEDSYRDFISTARVGQVRVRITVKAWNDDPAWGRRTSEALTEALPLLGRLIGVEYLGTPRLVARETVPRTIGGYAGTFDTSLPNDEISIAFDADEAVTLHEAAHAWFNRALAQERWFLEGFAEYYGSLAARRLGVEPNRFRVTPRLRQAAFPLAEWSGLGVEDLRTELFAYAASLETASAIVERAGRSGVTVVFVAMREDEAAYQPKHLTGEPETIAGHPEDWGYLLDLLEERTGKRYGAIMRRWVVPERDRDLLGQREAARRAYAELLDETGAWEVPETTRAFINRWAFDRVTDEVEEAEEILARRDDLAEASEPLGLALPADALQSSFEDGNFRRAMAQAEEVDEALAAYAGARAADDGEDLFESLGLVGADPDAQLQAAAAAFEGGEFDDAATAADAARTTWNGARETGMIRAGVAAGGAVVVLGGMGLGLGLRRRRRSTSIPGRPAKAAGTSRWEDPPRA